MSNEILSTAEILQEKLKKDNESLMALNTTIEERLLKIEKAIEDGGKKLSEINEKVKTGKNEIVELKELSSKEKELIKILDADIEERSKRIELKKKEEEEKEEEEQRN